MTTFKQAGVMGRPKVRAIPIRRRKPASRSEPIQPRTILLTLRGGVYTSALAVGAKNREEADAVGSAIAAFLNDGGKLATIGEQWAVRVIDHG